MERKRNAPRRGSTTPDFAGAQSGLRLLIDVSFQPLRDFRSEFFLFLLWVFQLFARLRGHVTPALQPQEFINDVRGKDVVVAIGVALEVIFKSAKQFGII